MKVPKQPEVNIGMVGHVDHGKTTLTKLLSGEWTDRHSEELKRGISIRLGYADTAFYRCPKCEEPECYTNSPICKICNSPTEFWRAVSFVDAPGHETLMATMLSGAAIMNGAILLIAANEKCPQPQTKEHLMALDIVGIKNIIIVQNKIDIVTEEQARKNYKEILEFIQGSIAENAPIIPISAHHEVNIDYLIQTIENVIPSPEHDMSKPAKMYIARSFDVNKPGTKSTDLVGGVIGGSLLQGKIKVGDEIEISPGRKIEKKSGVTWEPLVTRTTKLFSGGKSVKYVKPGGLVAVGTKLDPVYTKSDALIGRIVGHVNTLPNISFELSMDTYLLERVVGSVEEMKVDTIKINEPLMLSIGCAITVGIVKTAKADTIDISLKIPVCAEKGQRTAISRKIGGKWRLIGYGIIK
jgi:translation initiation factor 2 subunit 3